MSISLVVIFLCFVISFGFAVILFCFTMALRIAFVMFCFIVSISFAVILFCFTMALGFAIIITVNRFFTLVLSITASFGIFWLYFAWLFDSLRMAGFLCSLVLLCVGLSAWF